MSSQYQVINHLYVMTYLFDLPKYIKLMITYILQSEIPFRVKILNLCHDLLLGYDLIDTISSIYVLTTYI